MSNMDEYSRFIASSRYARWLDEEGRRETWPETVDRYTDFLLEHAAANTALSKSDLDELKEIMG